MRFHPYHLVTKSPYPFLLSINIYFFIFFSTLWFHKDMYEYLLINFYDYMSFSVAIILLIFLLWIYDLNIESSYEKSHTKRVQIGLKSGFILFIISEIMFFFFIFLEFFSLCISSIYSNRMFISSFRNCTFFTFWYSFIKYRNFIIISYYINYLS